MPKQKAKRKIPRKKTENRGRKRRNGEDDVHVKENGLATYAAGEISTLYIGFLL